MKCTFSWRKQTKTRNKNNNRADVDANISKLL